MEIIINYTEHEYQDAYVEPHSGEPVYTSYVELELNKAANECLEPYKCESVEITEDALPYKGDQDELGEVFVVVCRFNNLAANIFEDWNIVGCYVSEEEAIEVAEGFSLQNIDMLRGLSDSLILLYCDTHPLLFEKA